MEYYLIGFKTKQGDGTNSDVNVQLFDVNGRAIYGEFEVTKRLHTITGNALKSGSWQFGYFPIPIPMPLYPPEVYFLKVVMKGSDSWDCEYIHALAADGGYYESYGSKTQQFLDDLVRNNFDSGDPDGPEQSLLAGPKFNFNQTFSTDRSEGAISRDMPRADFIPQTVGEPKASVRSVSTFHITDNMRGSAPINSVVREVSKVRQDVLTYKTPPYSKEVNPIYAGVAVAFDLPSLTGQNEADLPATYIAGWRGWRAGLYIEGLLDASVNTYLFADEPVPANTLRITELAVDYTVEQYTVSNGIGSPADLELVRKQDLSKTKVITHDITKENAQDEWVRLSWHITDKNPSQQEEMSGLEAELVKLKWYGPY